MDENRQLAVWFAVIVLTVAGFLWLVESRSGPTDVWDLAPLTFVSGTEYNIGDAGQTITEARYANGTSALQSCVMSIWYPDKSLFTSQNSTAGPNGNHYITFTVPNTTGIYEYQADCVLDGNRTGVISKSFHVSEFQNDTSTKLNRVRAVMPK